MVFTEWGVNSEKEKELKVKRRIQGQDYSEERKQGGAFCPGAQVAQEGGWEASPVGAPGLCKDRLERRLLSIAHAWR